MGDWARRNAGWLVPLALYAVAVGLRLLLLDVRPFGDEAHHYFIAREFGQPPANLVEASDTRWLFWWRPLFSILLVPGAMVSFTAFRLGHIVLASLAAPAMWWWLRGRGVRPVASAAAGAVLAAHPYFVLWGVRAFPDGLMAAAFLGGLACWQARRHAWGLVLLLVAIWVKEVALIGVLGLCGLEALDAVRRRTAQGPALHWRHAGLLVVLALAWVPHWYALAIGGRDPGWSRGGDLRALLDAVFLTTLALPFVLAALASWRARVPALLALAYAVFYGYYTWKGGATEHWYYVLPAALGVGAIAAGLDAWCALARRWLPTAAAARATLQGLPVLAVALVVAAQVALPAAAPAKAVLHPGLEVQDESYAEMMRHERQRDQAFWHVIGQATDEDWQGVLTVDVPWFYPLWPLSDRAGAIGSYYTDNGRPPQDWAFVIEELANMTLVWRTGAPHNDAILATYADCIAVDSSQVALVRGQDCRGRAARLQAAWDG